MPEEEPGHQREEEPLHEQRQEGAFHRFCERSPRVVAPLKQRAHAAGGAEEHQQGVAPVAARRRREPTEHEHHIGEPDDDPPPKQQSKQRSPGEGVLLRVVGVVQVEERAEAENDRSCRPTCECAPEKTHAVGVNRSFTKVDIGPGAVAIKLGLNVPIPLLHRVDHEEGGDLGARKSDERHFGRSEHGEARNVCDSCDELLRRFAHHRRLREVAFLAERVERCPGGGDRSAGLRAEHRRIDDAVAGPGGAGEHLKLPQFLRAIEDDARPLRAKAVFVEVHRETGHAVDAEVEGGDRRAELLEKREEPGADAAVDVAKDPARLRDRGDLRHRVDDAVRIARRRNDDECGSIGEDRLHRFRPDFKGDFVDGDRDQLDVEVLGRLVKRGVGGHRNHDLRFGDPTDFPRVVAGRLHGEHAALGAATCEVAGGPLGRIHMRECDRNDVIFHLAKGREDRRIEGIFRKEFEVSLLLDRLDFLAGRIDVGPDATAVHRHVAAPVLLESALNDFFRPPTLRKLQHGARL
ncbi:hypothetical protein OUZ56_033084 [Daphnia magna]|uniref:Uncharacterized protein n=1 Tax=Daphnia magna TaxID=35525 RepID=A0ABR0BA44_9CRUS|nr:hypothetical protein OUZ56_033084 [Daphnia magna]